MSYKRRAAALVASLALATGGPLLGAAPASAASCTHWNDVNTYGVSCSGQSGYVRAAAQCNNGSYTYGPWRSANSGGWSYAYCAGKGGLNFGWAQFG